MVALGRPRAAKLSRIDHRLLARYVLLRALRDALRPGGFTNDECPHTVEEWFCLEKGNAMLWLETIGIRHRLAERTARTNLSVMLAAFGAAIGADEEGNDPHSGRWTTGTGGQRINRMMPGRGLDLLSSLAKGSAEDP